MPAEVAAIVRDGADGRAGRPSRHPCPRRHRAGGGQYAGRGRGRRPPDPGHAQRHRRALRQRQPRDADPDADAEAGLRRSLRDRHRRRAARPPDPDLPRLRRSSQPRAGAPGALCRRLGLRHQGRHPRLGAGQGFLDLRARAARERRQRARHHGQPAGGQVQPADRARAATASTSPRTTRGSTGCCAPSRSARRAAIPTTAPMPRSPSSPARRWERCRNSSRSRAIAPASSAATTPAASRSRSPRRWSRSASTTSC